MPEGAWWAEPLQEECIIMLRTARKHKTSAFDRISAVQARSHVVPSSQGSAGAVTPEAEESYVEAYRKQLRTVRLNQGKKLLQQV